MKSTGALAHTKVERNQSETLPAVATVRKMPVEPSMRTKTPERPTVDMQYLPALCTGNCDRFEGGPPIAAVGRSEMKFQTTPGPGQVMWAARRPNPLPTTTVLPTGVVVILYLRGLVLRVQGVSLSRGLFSIWA